MDVAIVLPQDGHPHHISVPGRAAAEGDGHETQRAGPGTVCFEPAITASAFASSFQSLSCTRLSRTFTPLYDSYGISTLLNSNEYDRVAPSSPGGSKSRTVRIGAGQAESSELRCLSAGAAASPRRSAQQ